jgi:hypothetical protein
MTIGINNMSIKVPSSNIKIKFQENVTLQNWISRMDINKGEPTLT